MMKPMTPLNMWMMNPTTVLWVSQTRMKLESPYYLWHIPLKIKMKQRLANEDLASKAKEVLSCMKQQKINLPILLDALSWGDADPEIQYYARTSIMVSDELPGILRRWYKPPQSLIHKNVKRPLQLVQVVKPKRDNDFVTA
jgi:hypothetical protein